MNGTQIKIRGYHCDAYGHVNNARYLELLEEARWQFLEPAIQQSFFKNHDLLFIVVNINIAYKKPLVPNQTIIITVADIRFNNKSIVVTQEIWDDTTKVLCSTADVSFVLLDAKTGKPESISEKISSLFKDLKQTYSG